MKILSILLFTMAFSFFHAEHIAEYSYQLSNDQLSLKFVIDKTEVGGFNFNSVCDIKQMTALCLTKYINEKSEVKINGKAVEFMLNDSYTEKDHLVINLSANVTSDSITELIISNNCFYEFNAKFKNRVILDIAQFQKSYLLTKKERYNSFEIKRLLSIHFTWPQKLD
ncbi:DUF6702 family protein [Lacinutrix jangbogonensis]|uniref:DUF6702 family protein n=1 Tax=Lacinutrix jangbogonensis TaxID=1469557 RepID=UPI0012E07124|nr:DUF6702 family protein [Lacinutrix jangbogonensis]